MDNTSQPVTFYQRAIGWLIISTLIWQPMAPAVAAAISPTGPASMDSAANGVPVLNIATPNGAGISHNQFKDYNVGKEGLILNNATGQLNQTQLGGLIQNNPNLRAGQEARGIINEVTGGSRSQLQGYTEVAGKAANVIVANPYGITCDGCGFINTPNATLTTGKPQFDDKGNLSALNVTGGTITVEGKGLDASQSDALSLISRATEVNAAIHARDLQVIAGANRVGADGSVSALEGEGPAPTVAVDTGALGGMYANRIHLVSSEKGVGVNLGNLNARQGDIQLDASGKLVLKDTLAGGALDARADEVQLSGSHKTGGALTVAGQQGVNIDNATLASDSRLTLQSRDGNTTLTGSKLTGGEIALAGKKLAIDDQSQMDSAARTELVADTITTHGKLIAGGDTRLRATQTNNHGLIAAKGHLDTDGDTLNNTGTLQGGTLSLSGKAIDNNGTLAADTALKINAGSLNAGADSVLTSKGDIALTAAQKADLDGRINADGALSVTADSLLTRDTSQLQSAGDLTLKAAGDARLEGTLAGKGKMAVDAQSLVHSGKSNAANISLTASPIHNSGTLVADTLTLKGDSISNSGLLLANEDMAVKADTLNNEGTLGAQSLTLTADTVKNNGTLQGSGTLAVQVNGLINGQSGQLLSAGILDISGDSLENNGLVQGNRVGLKAGALSTGTGSYTLSDGVLTLDAGQLNTLGTLQGLKITVGADDWIHGGSLLGLDAVDVTANRMLTNSGDLLSQGAMAFYAEALTNSGQLVSVGDITLAGDRLENKGNVQGDNLILRQDYIHNQGTLTGVNGLTLEAQSRLMGRMAMAAAQRHLINDATGTLQTSGTLNISSDEVVNDGSWQGQNILLSAGALKNTGSIQSSDALKLELRDALNAGEGSKITANGNAALEALNLTNLGEWSAKNLTLKGDTFTNNGSVLGDSALTVEASQVVQQENGKLLSGGNIGIVSSGLNTLGQIAALGDLTLQSTNTIANGATLVAGKALSVSSDAAIDNRGIMQGEGVTLTAGGELTNRGKIAAGKDGSTLSGKQIVIADGSSLQSGGDTTLTSRGDITLNGFTGTQGDLAVHAPGSIINTALLYAGKNMALYADSIKNQGGDILAGKNLWLQKDATGNASKEILNISGNIETETGDISLKAESLLNARQGMKVTEVSRPGQINKANAPAEIKVDVRNNPDFFVVRQIIDDNSGTGDSPAGDLNFYTLVPYFENININKELGSKEIIAISDGVASQITSGNDINIDVSSLNNEASSIYAKNNISLRGILFDNKTITNGVYTDSLVYEYIPNKNISYVNKTSHNLSSKDEWADVKVKSKSGEVENSILYYRFRHPASGNEYFGVVNYDPDLKMTFSERSLDIDGGSDRPRNGSYYVDPEPGIGGHGQGFDQYGQKVYANRFANYKLKGQDTRFVAGESYRAVIQAGGNITANFSDDISNTAVTANAGKVSNTIVAPALNPLSSQTDGDVKKAAEGLYKSIGLNTPEGRDEIDSALALLNGGREIDNGKGVDTSAWPLPSDNNGYFVTSENPKSPYLITVNPALNNLGALDPALFGNLNKLLGTRPGAAPRETNSLYTDTSNFLGSAYMLGRLNINPENDYRFLGDAAFDTRYVTNTVLNQTGNRYLNGVGSDLEQMRYLMDSAAAASQPLGLQLGVALTADQVASLDHSILWWESVTLNGETVMVPKVYLSPKDVTLNSGSVITANNVQINGSNITNDGSTLLAKNDLSVSGKGALSNLNGGTIKAGNAVALNAIADIRNIGSDISGKTVQIASTDGNISSVTRAEQIELTGKSRQGTVAIKDTNLGVQATIHAQDLLSVNAGKDINLTGAKVLSDGDVSMLAGRDINVSANQINQRYNQSGFHGIADTGNSRSTQQVSTVAAGGNLTLTAGRDLTSQAASLAAGEQAGLQAGRDVNLQAEATTSGNSSREKKHTVVNDHVRQQGTEITSGGDTLIVAGHDVKSQATQILAEKDIGIAAQNDISLLTATESDYRFEEKTKTKKGFLSKKTTHTVEEHSSTNELSTLLSGDNVSLQAGNDLLIRGSAVAADGDIALRGGGDVTVDAATEHASDYSMKKTTKSGFFGNGLGITIGSQSAQETRNGAQVTQSDSRSMIGTTAGNIIIEAGDKATLVAANMVAGRDAQDTTRKTGHIDVKASDIDIVAGKDVVTGSVEQKSKSSGVGITLSNPIIDTVRNIRDIAKTSGGSNITRAKTIASEAGASVLDISSEGMSLPVSYGKSSSKSEMHYAGEYAVGSTLASGGNVQLNATGNKGNGDVLIHGSNIGAKEAAIIDAQGNVDITASTDKQVTSSESSSKNWSITSAMPTMGSTVRTLNGGPNNGSSILPFGYGKSDSKEYSETTAQTGSQITAEDIYINSKDGHVNVSGSALAAINDLMLTAKNGDITVDTGNNHVVKETSGSQTQIGPLGGDGYSGTVGWSRDKYASQLDQNQQSTLRSQIASRDGDVTLAAGNDVAIDGADISAGKSVNISGENVRLDVSEDRLKSHSESSNTQYGVKASASGWVVSAAQAVENAARSVEENRDPRLSAIYAAQAGLNIASQTMQSDMNPSAVKVTVSATAGSSKQKQDYSSQQQQGTTLKAGDAVNISADKDITGAGVNIAGKNVNLDAGRDIILATARDKEALKNTASGNQFSAGVGFGLGGSQNGFSIELGASTYSNKENGDGLVHNNSQIVADETLTVNSGRDTTLKGTELKGDKVAVDVGRNLIIASQQDEQNYESKNKSGGVNVSICVPPICAGSTVSGTANAAGGKIANEYKSVIDQSGIFAGQGGFDVHVGEHTQLDGAVIASDATADKNRLDTGTLGWTDIENKAKSGGSQYAVSVSGGVGQNEDGSLKPIASGLPTTSLASVSDSDSSTTRSAVADGEIIIRDKDNQQQDITGLSRDTANAHQALDNSFDKDKIRDRLETQTQAVALGTQAMDAWRTSKLSDEKAKIRAEMEAKGELKGLSDAQINAKIEHSEQYKKVDEKYGVGSEFWRNGTAITGLLAGVLGGNVTGGMAAGAAPYVAGLIKDAAGDNNAARIALHTLASAVLVKAQGGNSAAGAAGGFIAASSSEALAQAFYDKSADELSPEEKTVISNLVTALGAAGGSVAGGGSQGIGGGANAARVEVENNSLGLVVQGGKLAAQGCMKISACRDWLIASGVGALLGIGASTSALDALSQSEKMNLIYIASLDDPSQLSKLNDAQKAAYESLTGKMLPDTGPTHTGGDQIVDPGPTHTGGDQIVDQGSTHTGGNQSVDQLPSHTGNTEGAPDLPTYYESGNKITKGEHATIRNKEGRPVGSAINDVQKSRPADILVQNDGRWVVLGKDGKAHLLEPDGEVVTSFKNPKANTIQRINSGKWQRPDNAQLDEFKNKFSDYVRW